MYSALVVVACYISFLRYINAALRKCRQQQQLRIHSDNSRTFLGVKRETLGSHCELRGDRAEELDESCRSMAVGISWILNAIPAIKQNGVTWICARGISLETPTKQSEKTVELRFLYRLLITFFTSSVRFVSSVRSLPTITKRRMRRCSFQVYIIVEWNFYYGIRVRGASLIFRLFSSLLYSPRRNKLAVMSSPINLAKIDFFSLCNRIYSMVFSPIFPIRRRLFFREWWK